MKHLTKLFRATIAIAIMLCVALPTFAYDFQSGDLYYTIIDETNKTVEVDDCYSSITGALSIPSSVTYNSTTYSVTSIGSSAFYDCSCLTSVTIPNSVTSIGEDAFYYCTGLTSVTIPNSVISIGESAFLWCSGLTSVTIGNSVTSIGNSAFYGCSCLTSVTIPYSVTSIGEDAFNWCTGLTSIVVEKGNTKYDSRDNCNAIIETATNTLMSGCKNTTILNSVTSIGYGAFRGCSGLTSVTIPNSVTTIDSYAFEKCRGLTSVTIGNSVTKIGSYAFDYCNIPVLHLPKSVTYVGEFNCCADVCYCYNPTPPSGGGFTSYRLFVPKGSLMAYATAEGWKDAEQILEFEVDDVVKPILTIAYPEGGVIKQTVDNGEILMLQIVPANGWKCNSVTFNGIDVTNQLDAKGNYNTPSITANSQLSIVFVKNDGSVANALVDSDIKVYVKGNTVTITGADEFSDVEIYNTAGTTIYTGIDKSITIDSTGIYILTVEGRTFKFAM